MKILNLTTIAKIITLVTVSTFGVLIILDVLKNGTTI